MELNSFDYFLQIGAIEMVGVDRHGEMTFKISDKCKEVAPELWAAHQKHIDETLIMLLHKGLINVTYNENLEALIEVSEEGQKEIQAMGLFEFPDNYEGIPDN